MARFVTPKGQAKLLQGLASGLSVRGAAMQAGIAERTAWRRLRDPSFRKELGELRAQAMERAALQLTRIVGDAVARLNYLLGAQSEAVELGAARTILEFSLRVSEQHDIEVRLAELEAVLDVKWVKQ